MVELIIEVKNEEAYLATWYEDRNGVRIERLTVPNVTPKDIEEAIEQSGGSLFLEGTYTVSTKILRKISPIRKDGRSRNLDKKRFCDWI
jgi:hypothetical protein